MSAADYWLSSSIAMNASSSALEQHPQAPQVDQNFHVLFPHSQTFLAQARLALTVQGADPPLHEAQLDELICQRPTSSDPLVLCNYACAFPPLSCLIMH